MFVGITTLIVMNTLIFGFVTWLPTFFVQEGLGIARSFNYTLVMSLGAPIGSAIGALTADFWGRRSTIVAASSASILVGGIYPFVKSPHELMLVGFLLMIAIYILVSLLFAIYIPELFPTEVRLRAAGICNMFGRGATTRAATEASRGKTWYFFASAMNIFFSSWTFCGYFEATS